MRPAAHLLFFASPKKSRQKKGDPTCRVPSLRCGQPAMLGHGAALRNSLCAFGALLGQPQRVRARSMVLLRSPCPPHALRFSARPEGTRENTGRRFARPRPEEWRLDQFWRAQEAAEQAMQVNAVLGLAPSTGVVPPHEVRGGKAPQATQGGVPDPSGETSRSEWSLGVGPFTTRYTPRIPWKSACPRRRGIPCGWWRRASPGA